MSASASWLGAALGAVVIFCVSLIFYLSFPTQFHEFDAYSFARTAGNNGPLYRLFHPHHLLYPSTGWIWFKLTRGPWNMIPPLASLQEFNACLGAAGAAALFVLARLMCRNTVMAFAAAAGMAASYAYWNSAIEASARTVSCLLLILTALAARIAGGRRFLWAVPGAFLGFSCLAHQTNVLMGPAIAGFAMIRRGLEWRSRVHAALLAIVIGGTVAIAGYAVVGRYVLKVKSWPVLVKWSAGYLTMNPKGSGAGTLANPFHGRLYPSAEMTRFERARFGWKRAFVGIKDANVRILAGIRGGQLRALVFWWFALFACALPVLLLPFNRELLRAAVPLLLWLAAYVPFFYFWEPGNLQFWVTSLPAVWLLFALAGTGLEAIRSRPGPFRSGWRALARSLALGLVVTLAVLNFKGRIVNETDPERSTYWKLHQALDAVRRSGDELVIGGWNAVPYYLTQNTEHGYFSVIAFLRATKGTGEERIGALREKLASLAGEENRVLCLKEVLEPRDRALGFLARLGITREMWEKVLEEAAAAGLAGQNGDFVYELKWPEP